MMNTPPTFAIYVTGLVCDWLRDEIGGLEKMHKINRDKSKMLYDTVDQLSLIHISEPTRPY